MMDALEEYRSLYAKLVALDDTGKGESPEAEELRDQMDAPWYAMTDAELAEFKADAEGKSDAT